MKRLTCGQHEQAESCSGNVVTHYPALSLCDSEVVSCFQRLTGIATVAKVHGLYYIAVRETLRMRITNLRPRFISITSHLL